jgi:hypothetical protein
VPISVPGAGVRFVEVLSIGTEFFGTQELQIMKSFISPAIFVYPDFSHPEGDHPVGGEGQGEALAVDVDNRVQGKPGRNFLHIPFGKDNKVLIHEHKSDNNDFLPDWTRMAVFHMT